METETDSMIDPAAVFACALSLWKACHEYAAKEKDFNLSECFNGIDQLMREAMAIGARFEEWAAENVRFDEIDGVWPYMLEDDFGPACLALLPPSALLQFNERDCLRVALRLRLPVRFDQGLPVPVDLSVPNPIGGGGFSRFRIQTVRNALEDDLVEPFTMDDDPFDEDFGGYYFSLYGVGASGEMEHIADRKSYGEAVGLARKLAPGIEFPADPHCSTGQVNGEEGQGAAL